jgi:hypothetical protein
MPPHTYRSRVCALSATRGPPSPPRGDRPRTGSRVIVGLVLAAGRVALRQRQASAASAEGDMLIERVVATSLARSSAPRGRAARRPRGGGPRRFGGP